jgi:hypothetical protein
MNPSVLPLTEAAASADGNGDALVSDPGRDPKRDRSDGWRSENTTGDSGESAVAPLNVVIAYDDIPAGQRALSMLTRLLGQEIQTVNLHRSIWRLDFINEPECCEQIIADTTAADLLILSTGEPEAHPSAIEDWVSAFLSQRRGASTAILYLLGCPDNWSLSIQESVIERTDPQTTAMSTPAPASRLAQEPVGTGAEA